MKNQTVFTKRLLASCISAASIAYSGHLSAQDTDSVLEEVVVTGVRQSQENAIAVKRNAASIVDAISAEDIGKLPDTTITDSLQRITGIQINRDAGEGAGINIRGLPQVLTMLNGESYLGANSITVAQPNFNDIPSQLFSGADVVKSQTASQHPGGVTGVVNLKTYRPFDFDDGFTVSGAVQVGTGEDSDEADPSLNGLINWKGDNLGFMVSASFQDKNLANFRNGMSGNSGWQLLAGEDWAYDWVNENTGLDDIGGRIDPESGAVDVNGNGVFNDGFFAYQGHSAEQRFNERERTGINASFQADFGSGFELIAEAFYTNMDDYQRSVGLATSDKWQRWGWFSPTQATEKGGVVVDGRQVHTVQEFTGNGRRLKSSSTVQVTESESTNFNIELNYDNGGPFTGSARFVYGDAEQEQLNSTMDIDTADGNQWGVDCIYLPPGTDNPQGGCPDGQFQSNPGGIAGFPELTINYAGSDPVWSGFDNNANVDTNGQPIDGTANRSARSFLEDVDSFTMGALIGENNFTRDGELSVIRFDGNYEFQGEFLTSVDFGVRYSAQEVDNEQFDLLSPIGENDCAVKWKATDVVLNGGGIEGACTSGLSEDGPFFTSIGHVPISSLDAIQVSDFGEAKGIPSIWTVDPKSMDNVEAFHEAMFPGTFRSNNPGRSFEVDLDETSFFAQANFQTGILTGNFGVRYVETELDVLQNVVGAAQPFGAANLDGGDVNTNRDWTDILPSLNLNFALSERWNLRAAVTKTTAPLDLEQWGGALDTDFTIDSEPGSPTEGKFIVVSGSSLGNPELDPWEATNFDLSLEYYLGPASLISVSTFYIDVDSFIESGTEERALPDQDGVVRRTVSVNTPVQGEGGQLRGFEYAVKLALGDITDNPFLRGFGIDANYTFSPSTSGNFDLRGEELPFQDNSEDVANLVGWYEQGPWQARIAYNYRSERVVGFDQAGISGHTLWQDDTAFLDASVSYDITDDISIFINASNITSENEEFFLSFKDQFAWQNEFERRYSTGIRATF